MMASDFIKLIQESIDKHGDLPVVVKTYNEFCRNEYDECEVEFLKEFTENGWYYNEKGTRVIEKYAFVITTKIGEW